MTNTAFESFLGLVWCSLPLVFTILVTVMSYSSHKAQGDAAAGPAHGIEGDSEDEAVAGVVATGMQLLEETEVMIPDD